MNSQGLWHQQSQITVVLQVPGKHEFSEKFERERFCGGFVGKGELHNIVNCLCKLQSQNVYFFLFYFCLYFSGGKVTDQSRVDSSPNPEFIPENNLKHIL